MEDLFKVREARPSAVESVIEKIKELLIERKLAPGDMIPNENALAESLKVGRGTIREALKILSAYGVVEIKQGHGTFISSASNKRLFNPQLFQILIQDRDYISLTQVRHLLEEGLVKLVIENATNEELGQLDEKMNEFAEVLANNGSSAKEAARLDLEYHRMLGQICHNPIVENIYVFVIDLFTKTINPIHEGVDTVHRRLHSAIMNRNAAQAVDAVYEHTEIWKQAYQATKKDQ
ncbi:MAG: FadR family transcriptional regulator [Spirochaetales bacterium]|nr:FadR family transcriptional regulator [Spirochaetales bacterium]